MEFETLPKFPAEDEMAEVDRKHYQIYRWMRDSCKPGLRAGAEMCRDCKKTIKAIEDCIDGTAEVC